MSLAFEVFGEKSRLKSLLEHFSRIEDPREPWRVAHSLAEVLLLVVCATMADCDDYDAIAAWGEAHVPFLRRYLPYHYGVPGGRWLKLLVNCIDPALFSAAFTAWVRETWPDRPDFIAIDGKTSRRSHDRAENKAPLHLVSAFATTRRLAPGQEAVEGKAIELAAIPALIDRLAERGGLKGALVSIDAVGADAKIAQTIKDAGADYLFAAKANQPTLLADIESAFALAASVDEVVDYDKGHGRIQQMSVSVIAEVDWLDGERRFPGEVRLPGAASIVRVRSRAELADRRRFETRYYVSSRVLSARLALEATRGHWGVDNRLHWVLDVVFAEDQGRLRKGHGAENMAVVRHSALNLIRASPDKRSIKLRRKIAG
jgi:predicted transposase YbfD/YdcC